MALFGNGPARGIAIGDRPIAPLDERMAFAPGDRALAREQRDWMLVRSVVQPGERPWLRVAVRFPDQNNVPGHMFLTNHRLLFEYREKVLAMALSSIEYVGRPTGSNRGDLAIQAVAPTSYGDSRVAMVVAVKDTEGFYDFFPTLVAAAFAAGATPEVLPGRTWASEPSGSPASAPQDNVPTGGAGPVISSAVAGLLRPGEDPAITADMIHNIGGEAVHLTVTGERLIVVDGGVAWAAELGEVRVIDGGVAGDQLRLLAQTIDHALSLGRGGGSVIRLGAQRLVLRALHDQSITDGLRRHLSQHGGGVLPAWPYDGGN